MINAYLKEKVDFILNQDISNINIYLVCNVKGRTITQNDYSITKVETEYFSENEFEEILTACQNERLYTESFFTVEEFILKIDDIPHNSIIFESSQRGVGKARDSLVPAICDLHNLAYSGCNAYVNAICSSKYHWSIILQSHCISTPLSYLWTTKNHWLYKKPIENRKYIIKPVYECASIGITADSIQTNLLDIENNCFKTSSILNQPLIVQEFIRGYEVEIPIVASKDFTLIFPIVGIERDNNKLLNDVFLSYDIVYEDNYNFYLFSNVSKNICIKIREICYKVIDILDLEGYFRIDMRIDKNGNIYIFDINPYPHIVRHSSFSYSFQSLGYSADQLILFIIKLAYLRSNSLTKFVNR